MPPWHQNANLPLLRRCFSLWTHNFRWDSTTTRKNVKVKSGHGSRNFFQNVHHRSSRPYENAFCPSDKNNFFLRRQVVVEFLLTQPNFSFQATQLEEMSVFLTVILRYFLFLEHQRFWPWSVSSTCKCFSVWDWNGNLEETWRKDHLVFWVWFCRWKWCLGSNLKETEISQCLESTWNRY